MASETTVTIEDMRDPGKVFRGVALEDRTVLAALMEKFVVQYNIDDDPSAVCFHLPLVGHKGFTLYFETSNLDIEFSLLGGIHQNGQIRHLKILVRSSNGLLFDLPVNINALDRLESLRISNCNPLSFPHQSLWNSANLHDLYFDWSECPDFGEQPINFPGSASFPQRNQKISWRIGGINDMKLEKFLFEVLPLFPGVCSLTADIYYGDNRSGIQSFRPIYERLNGTDSAFVHRNAKLSLRELDLHENPINFYIEDPSMDGHINSYNSEATIPKFSREETAAVCGFLRAFPTIVRLCVCFDSYHPDIQHELLLNWAGRGVVEFQKSTSHPLPLSLWPIMMAREHPSDKRRRDYVSWQGEGSLKVNYTATAIYYLLRNGPVLRGGI